MSQGARALVDETITERQFQEQVKQLARALGWECYHTFMSHHSEPGFPDLVLVHGALVRIVYAELKTMKGKVSAHQVKWLATLTRAGGETYLWRPNDWPRIERILRGEREQ